MLGFSLISPDLVICAGSPDVPRQSRGYSPKFLRGASSTVVSLENGIDGSEKGCLETPEVVGSSTFWQESTDKNVSQEADFELPPPPVIEDESQESPLPLISINVGSMNSIVSSVGVKFSEDKYFIGGGTTRTETAVGDIEYLNLYQSARIGNFTYNFNAMEPGLYSIDLHLAEIVLIDGPSGMRVFDVFIQEQKVRSYRCLRRKILRFKMYAD